MAPEITEEGTGLQQHIQQYKEAYDPLYMMALLIDLLRKENGNMSDEDWRQISGCHNLLAAIVRNE